MTTTKRIVSFIGLPRGHRCDGGDFLTLLLSEEISWPYNRPFPFHRLVLRSAQRNFPFGAAVAVIKSDGVGNPKVAVDWAVEAGCIASMAKLRRWGFTDWAKEGHGLNPVRSR